VGFKVKWLDSGREPECRPDPEFPAGRDLPCMSPGLPNCRTALLYPAKRCGVYIVECTKCGIVVGVTTAGRPDDPRSVKINCLRSLH
jgi:hypothetical protein